MDLLKWTVCYSWKSGHLLWIVPLLCVGCIGRKAAPAKAALADTSWILVGFGPVDAPTTPIPGSEITAVFTADKLTGTSGCNQYSSPYTIDGSAVQISELAATSMDCPSLLLAQEAQFMAALAQATGFSLTENRLIIETAVTPLIFSPLEPVPLENTPWQLTGIAQDGVMISTGLDVMITAVFANGELSGNAGCNHYTGTYTLDDEALAIPDTAHEEAFCDEERSRQETQFLTALNTVTRYTIDQNSLTLQDTAGSTLLTFTKAPEPNPLSGIIWKLVALETADGPLPAQGSLVTAQFMGGRVTGTGGCNVYSADTFLVADAYLLLLSNISHGFESCADPVQRLENSFFSLMETAESFTLDNDTLIIYSTRGSLSFTAENTKATDSFLFVAFCAHCVLCGNTRFVTTILQT
ncbi:MAG: META domain-containing protein [Anaerolineales bacterium]|nr:META domain-containing protein [Anaerolineales bacterium]